MILVNPDARSDRDIPNIGLAYIASVLGALVVDLNTGHAYPERLLDRESDVVGISVQSRTLSEFNKIAEAYQSKYPGARIASVRGILDVLCGYPYVSVGDPILCEEPFSDGLPFPDYSLLDSYDLLVDNWSKGVWHYSILTSRGCPHRCLHCSSQDQPWIARSAENCVAELEFAKVVHSIRSFQIVDECFNAEPQRVIDFCKAIGRLKLSWRVAKGLRTDPFNEEMAAALKEAGCVYVSFGFDSVDPAVLKAIGKEQTLEWFEPTVSTARRFFDYVGGHFVIGLPGSSKSSDMASLEWARRAGIHGFFTYHVPSQLMENALYCGEEAKPLSEAYSVQEQMEVFGVTTEMERRSRGQLGRFFERGKHWLGWKR